MSFDPFGDFETRGYLRNVFGEKDPDIIKRLEHSAFVAAIGEATGYLASGRRLTYGDVLKTHEILFGALYPWAGQDRLATAPGIAVSKGSVLFAHPRDARAAVEYGLKLGSDVTTMNAKPGEVMGYLAFGHPFLEGMDGSSCWFMPNWPSGQVSVSIGRQPARAPTLMRSLRRSRDRVPDTWTLT